MQNLLALLKQIDGDMKIGFMDKGHVSLSLELFEECQNNRAAIKEVAPLLEAMMGPAPTKYNTGVVRQLVVQVNRSRIENYRPHLDQAMQMLYNGYLN